ncbi:hypothetical protein [Limisalsivibrio acetivorans]|uniref:hypothetical protein n=1 Tax=Limisalsivibrio acetivorans TaxID=1304888 RepID=UPI0003B69C99|nr:hypothetical protein [Limisalsivibrio acetivorans]
MPEFSRFFTGSSLKYWYIAFVISLAWLIGSMVNARAVTQYEVTLYDRDGQVKDVRIVDKYRLQAPESLQVPKSYRPIKPVSFL